MKFYKIKKLNPLKFRRIIGIKKNTFLQLVNTLKPKWDAVRAKGGRKPRLTLENQLLLTLNYWRNYGTYLEIGSQFNVSESLAQRVSRWIENNLKHDKILHLPGKKQLLLGEKTFSLIVFDVTECPIERPKRKKTGRHKNRQKRYYSGKKKRHTIKQQVSIDIQNKKIISTSQANGKTHDFKVYKKSKNRVHPSTKIQADSGYQGIQKIHINSELPKKRSKKHPLTPEDKAYNKAISSQRVFIENVFAFLKKFKIISQKYRNRRKRFGLRFNFICAIFNYEWCA